MPRPENDAPTDRAPHGGWPDLPLIIEQLQDQIDALREVIETQQRQIVEHRARLDALEDR